VVTFNDPAVITKAPDIPITALPANIRELPLIVLLKRFTVPLNVEVPINVMVPAVAVKLPVQFREDETEKLLVVLMLPLVISALTVSVPALLIVLPVPFMVIVPELAISEPLIVMFPVSMAVQVVVTTPVTDRLSRFILIPVRVLVVPLIVSRPGAGCVNLPEPEVTKLPVILREVIAGAVILAPVIVRL